MKQSDHDADQRFDELLRELGPDVPQPVLEERTRARLMATFDSADALPALERIGEPRGWTKWMATVRPALAAMIALACVLLWISLGRVKDQLATSQWQTGEALQLLVNARQTQQSIPPPQQLDGVRGSDLVLVTFHHDLCPLARLCTPGFRDMEKRHGGKAVRFITFDVTGSKRDSVGKEIDALGMQYALLGPPGAETGVVKVLDRTHQRVLCSAPGEKGLEQAEQLLARVSASEHQP